MDISVGETLLSLEDYEKLMGEIASIRESTTGPAAVAKKRARKEVSAPL